MLNNCFEIQFSSKFKQFFVQLLKLKKTRNCRDQHELTADTNHLTLSFPSK